MQIVRTLFMLSLFTLVFNIHPSLVFILFVFWMLLPLFTMKGIKTISQSAIYHNNAPFGPRQIATVYHQVFDIEDLPFFGNNIFDRDDQIELPPNVEPAVANFIRGRQNVHDSHIQTGLSKFYNENLRGHGGATDVKRDELSAFFPTGKPTIDKLYNAHSQIMHKMSMYKMDSVFEVLYNVWKSGSENVRGALKTLLPTLNDPNICPTGVASRIVESAFIERPEDTPISKEMVHTSMLSKAGVLRSDAERNGLDSDGVRAHIESSLLEEYAPRYGSSKVKKILSEWGEFA